MARCEDCIYSKMCYWIANFGEKTPCEHFLSTADVAPKSEVAMEIFADIEELAKLYTFPVVKNGVVEISKEPFWCIETSDIAELKKKYTQEK